jgi:tetratricopeptide (TPR) repeat protein
MGGVFISHTHSDHNIVDALTKLLNDLFPAAFTINYSTSKGDGGIEAGDDWFSWIVNQVKGAELALIILTTASIQKPWVIWEAGAVGGASYATTQRSVRLVPVVFGIQTGDVPGPLAKLQLTDGVAKDDIKKLIKTIFSMFASNLPNEKAMEIGQKMDSCIDAYLQKVGVLMKTMPQIITEATIQEWISRIDGYARAKRYSEATVLENWLDVAFGREEDDKLRPIDARIHQRMGDLYQKAGKVELAIRQFKLACLLSPRDMFLLHGLAKAYLDAGNTDRSSSILDEMHRLDSGAFVNNVDNAALRARHYEAIGNKNLAISTLRDAYKNFSSSFYLADRIGQMLLQNSDLNGAKEIYKEVVATLGNGFEYSVWSQATALTGAIVLEDKDMVEKLFAGLMSLKPTRDEVVTIGRGLSNIRSRIRNTGDIDYCLELLGTLNN